MKKKSSGLSRREFMTVTTVGVALSAFRPGMGVVAGGQSVPSWIKPVGTSRLLYVTNDLHQTIDIYDTDAGHKLVHSMPWIGEFKKEGRRAFEQNDVEIFENKATGICAHPAQNLFFVTHREIHLINAYDVYTGKVVWTIPNTLKEWGQGEPDRQVMSADGSAIFFPMRSTVNESGKRSDWLRHVNLVVDPNTAKVIADPIPRPASPHNNWSGEGGQFAYLAGRSDQTLVLADQKTRKFAKTIGPFGSPIRQHVTAPAERYIYLTLTRTIGMGIADIQKGEVMADIPVQVPKERTKNWHASATGGGLGTLPHGDNPWSHGIGMRPGGSEDVYLLDNEWGYLYVFDAKTNPAKPKLKGHIPLFTDIEEPWNALDDRRWVSFSIDGKWCYPADGSVVDCESGKLTSMKIARSEKLIQLEFQDGKFVAASGQQGGVYGRRMT